MNQLVLDLSRIMNVKLFCYDLLNYVKKNILNILCFYNFIKWHDCKYKNHLNSL